MINNTIFPTISPSNKRNGEIESIKTAIEYYKDNNVDEIAIQPKYMGSAILVYLFRDIQQTYFTSRNGYVVKDKFHYSQVQDLHDRIIKQYPNFKLAIIATEQTPWTTLAKNFAEREFLSYITCHEVFLNKIKNNNLVEKLSKVIIPDGKLANHEKRTKEALELLQDLDYSKDLEKYKTQFNKFYTNDEIKFNAYCIQKIVLEDNSEIIPNDNHTFSIVNDDEYITIKIDKHIDDILDTYQFVLQSFLDKQDEGVVVKPSRMYIEGIVPALKVRNKNYLQLIYGIDFHKKYSEYYKKRKTKRKLELSINEWNIAWKLLNIPYNNITEEYAQLLNEFKSLKQDEKFLDKKL